MGFDFWKKPETDETGGAASTEAPAPKIAIAGAEAVNNLPAIDTTPNGFSYGDSEQDGEGIISKVFGYFDRFKQAATGKTEGAPSGKAEGTPARAGYPEVAGKILKTFTDLIVEPPPMPQTPHVPDSVTYIYQTFRDDNGTLKKRLVRRN